MDVADELSRLDREGLRFVADLRGEPFDTLFRELSAFWPRVLLLTAAVAWVSWRRRDGLAVTLTFGAVAVAFFATEAVKRLVERARPGGGFDPLGTLPHSFSFPSGHASTAFAAAVALGALAPRLRPVLLIVAALVAFSRVWLGVHYPSDVVVGALLGTAVAALLVWAAARAPGGLTPAASSGSRRRRAR